LGHITTAQVKVALSFPIKLISYKKYCKKLAIHI